MQTDTIYQELLLEEAKNPQNYGQLPKADISLSEGVAGCGDVATIFLRVEKDRVFRMTWVAEGCVVSRASLSLLSEAVVGKTVTELRTWTLQEILSLLQLDSISPGREQCALLGLRALQRALKHYSNQGGK